VLRESRARDNTKIEESSQPSSVAALSHHCMNAPERGAAAAGLNGTLAASVDDGIHAKEPATYLGLTEPDR
jgi:hypothetical protein